MEMYYSLKNCKGVPMTPLAVLVFLMVGQNDHYNSFIDNDGRSKWPSNSFSVKKSGQNKPLVVTVVMMQDQNDLLLV